METIKIKHPFEVKTFTEYLNYTLFLNRQNGGNICDFDCANAELLELHYRNRLGTSAYIGLIGVEKLHQDLVAKWKSLSWATFKVADLLSSGSDVTPFSSVQADKVMALNLPHGLTKSQFYYYLQNFFLCGHNDATYFIRLPKQTETITEGDFRFCIDKYFNVVERYGLSGTINEFVSLLSEDQKMFCNELRQYYSDEFIAGFMAPLFPDRCNEVMWVLKRKTATNTNL